LRVADAEKVLHLAAKQNDVLTILQLLAQAVDVDNIDVTNNNKTPLLVAVELNNFLSVQLLVLNRANIGALDSEKQNALHYAAKLGDYVCTSFLLKNCEKKSVIESENAKGETAMDIAVNNHNADIVELFLDYYTPGVK